MRVRGIRSALIAAGVCCTSLMGAGSASAAGTQNVENMVDSFRRCVQREGSADVLVLLDQSSSLSSPYTDSQGKVREATDPQDQRIDAAEDFVSELKGLADDSQVKVRVAVAGFDGNYHAGDWTALDSDSVGKVKDQVRAVGEKDDGRETDYVNALEGARGQFARSDGCQLLIFFTDGEYDVDGSYGTKEYSKATDWTKVEEDGRSLLCSAKKGPLNALRDSGVYVAGVGLSGDGDSGRLGFLRDMISTSECGQGPVPQKWNDRWAFLDIGNARDLAFEFNKLVTDSGGEDSTNPKGRSQIRFGLDPIITRLSVLADAGDDRLIARLINPDGKTVASSVAAGTAAHGGVTTTVSTVGAATTRFRVLPRDGDDLGGVWAVRFEPKKGERVGKGVLTRINIGLKSNLQASWTDPQEQLVTGSVTNIRAQVVKDGAAVPAADLPKTTISLDFRDASGTLTNLVPATPVADWERGVDVTLASNGTPLPAGRGKLALNLNVEMTTEPVKNLLPQVTSADVTIVAPPNYPTVDSAPLVLVGEKDQAAAGTDPSVGAVPLAGPGCVWLEQDATQISGLPQGIGEDQVKVQSAANSSDNCVRLAEGQTGTLALRAIPDVAGFGALTGSVVVVAEPAEAAGEPLKVTVPFTAERTKPVNAVTRIWLLILALFLGLGVPALILFAIRAATAKIPVSDPEAGDLVYVLKTPRRSGEAVETIALNRQDLRMAHDGSAATVKQLDVEGVLLRAVPFGNPFTVADVRAERAGTALVSDLSTGMSKDGTARLPLGLAGHWLAWRDSSDVRVLYFFSTNDLRSDDMSELGTRLSQSLDGQWHLLDEAASAEVPVGSAGTAMRPEDGGWQQGGGSAPRADDSWGVESDYSGGSSSADSWNATRADNGWDSGPESKDTW